MATNNPDLRKQYNRTYYLKNSEKYAERRENRRAEIRILLSKIKKDNPCTCGESHEGCISFHHRDPAGKDINVSDVVKHMWSDKRIHLEIAKCDIMCSNCHLKLHWKQRHP